MKLREEIVLRVDHLKFIINSLKELSSLLKIFCLTDGSIRVNLLDASPNDSELLIPLNQNK